MEYGVFATYIPTERRGSVTIPISKKNAEMVLEVLEEIKNKVSESFVDFKIEPYQENGYYVNLNPQKA